MSQKVYLYGKNPFYEAATKKDAFSLITHTYITKQIQDEAKVMSILQSKTLPYSIVTAQEIESMVGKNATHQGICSELKESSIYTTFEELLESIKNEEKNQLFVLLDELEDPHNVGSIIRSACAFGANAILIPEHGQVQINGTIIKASSGTVFSIPIVKIGNVNTVLKKLQNEKFWIYGLTGNGDTFLEKTIFDSKTVIVIGNEGDGIRQKTLEICDFKLAIKIDKKCESLNASNAAAVALYEWRKQNV